jgi:hypothetical protein
MRVTLALGLVFLAFITLFIYQRISFVDKSGKYDCESKIALPSTQEYLKKCLNNLEHIKINENVINVLLIPSDKGSERVIKVFKLLNKYGEVTISYIVKFGNEFDFAKGGKLHGLASSRVVSGGMERKKDGGWSVRVAFGKSGSLGVYYYLHKDQQEFGNFRFFENFKFDNDVEYKIKLNVKINSIGKDDGRICLNVDETKGFCIKNLEFCDLDCNNSYIEKFLFSVFHGGSNVSYSPRDLAGNPNTVSIDFREVKIF